MFGGTEIFLNELLSHAPCHFVNSGIPLPPEQPFKYKHKFESSPKIHITSLSQDGTLGETMNPIVKSQGWGTVHVPFYKNVSCEVE